MIFIQKFAFIAAAIAPLASATPVQSDLLSRDNNYAGCKPDQITKIKEALGDMKELADEAQHIDSASTAFTHFSRTDHTGKEEDLNKAKSLRTQVSKNSAPGHAYMFKCAPATDEDCKKGSLAVANANPQEGNTPRVITICPPFFSSKETANHLKSKEFKKNPGRRDNSWCKPVTARNVAKIIMNRIPI
ncbi:hypothetical protein LTS12_027170 [Elasticomyces elasticus]|nr:hypothetical protein LTS12_027170 [Elasticomyces elasticus]